MKGFIYILTNPSFSAVKIGMTKSDPVGRAKELSDTSSLPFAFELAWYALVDEYQKAERIVHTHFADVRANPKREFFEVAVADVIKAIKNDLDIVILYEELLIAPQNMDFEAASRLLQEERWKHFAPTAKFPFQSCPDCKKKCLGLLDRFHEIDLDSDDEDVEWAKVVGSIVSDLPEIDLSPNAPLIKPVFRQGPYFCWNCGEDKDTPLRRGREANFESSSTNTL